MDTADQRRRRAIRRRREATLFKGRLGTMDAPTDRVSGVEGVSLATQLSRESWSMTGRPEPIYDREHTPYHFVPHTG